MSVLAIRRPGDRALPGEHVTAARVRCKAPASRRLYRPMTGRASLRPSPGLGFGRSEGPDVFIATAWGATSALNNTGARSLHGSLYIDRRSVREDRDGPKSEVRLLLVAHGDIRESLARHAAGLADDLVE